MRVQGIKAPGARLVAFELDARTALDVYIHLVSSLHAEETTTSSRINVSGLLPPLRNALVQTGVISAPLIDEFYKHVLSKPAPPSLDQTIAAMVKDA